MQYIWASNSCVLLEALRRITINASSTLASAHRGTGRSLGNGAARSGTSQLQKKGMLRAWGTCARDKTCKSRCECRIPEQVGPNPPNWKTDCPQSSGLQGARGRKRVMGSVACSRVLKLTGNGTRPERAPKPHVSRFARHPSSSFCSCLPGVLSVTTLHRIQCTSVSLPMMAAGTNKKGRVIIYQGYYSK
jgi:hypothetical protein